MLANWKPVRRRQKGLDATGTKNRSKSHHGYKFYVNVDKHYKILGKIAADTASPHDSQCFEAVLDLANTNRDVYADKGYPSWGREKRLKAVS